MTTGCNFFFGVVAAGLEGNLRDPLVLVRWSRIGLARLHSVFGENLLPMLTLALGGALAVGTTLALIRPPAKQREGALERPPLRRSVVQIVLGLFAAVWAIATMVS